MKKEIRDSIIEKAARQVGPGVFYSTVVVVASFLPVFLLTGMEGKMFHPLAYTKTFILMVDAILAITLTPVLISFLLKGKLKPEGANPVTRVTERIYNAVLNKCLEYRKTTLEVNIIALLITVPMIFKMG
ncbi:efflux RND transporter permease subunit, partial [bacterium]|nr:efflux RND transporter permease subunit [bacterium]